MKSIPHGHEKWGGKFIDALKGPMGNPKSTFNPKASHKHA